MLLEELGETETQKKAKKWKQDFLDTAKTGLELLPQNDFSEAMLGESLSGDKVSGTERAAAGAGLAAGLLGKAKKCVTAAKDWWKARKAKKAAEKMSERLNEFYKRLGAQGRAGSADEALERLRSTMDEVEDAMSGVPKKSPPPAPGMPDGRMYPPLDDFVTRNADGSISAVTKGHRIEIGADGSTQIINKRTGVVEFEN
jgi:hypothetical protein